MNGHSLSGRRAVSDDNVSPLETTPPQADFELWQHDVRRTEPAAAMAQLKPDPRVNQGEHHNANEDLYIQSSRTQRPDPRVKQMRNLSTLDVAALIANKMIGTGIFTGPSIVLQLTLNKNLAIGLWTLGLFYTVLSMLLYIEYARKLPFTGGELVYMDDAMPKPRLLAYTLYAFYFVFLYTSCANCLNFSRFLLAAADTSFFEDSTLDSNQRLVRFIAVVVITAVGILLYVAQSKLVNKATAGAKVLLLLGAIGAGAAYVGKEQAAGRLSGKESQWSFTAQGNSRWPQALITVMFSFHGWENATLVAGEIDSFKVLRRGFLLAISVVGALYIAMAILLCAAFDWIGAGSLDDVPKIPLSLYLGGTKENTGAGAVGAAVLISLSAFGSIISVSYTCVRVKQSIGWANILPWSRIWRRQGPIQPEYHWLYNKDGQRELGYSFPDRALNRPGTPEGGIILHWVTTTVYICATAGYDSIRDAAGFAGNILVYGHFFAEAAVALLFIPIGSLGFQAWPVTYLPAWSWHENQAADAQAGNPPKWLRPPKMPWIGPLGLGGSVFVFSLVIIGSACAEESGRVLLYVVVGVLGSGLLYWFLFIRYRSAQVVYGWFGFSLEKRVHGVDDQDDPLRACDWCTVLEGAHRHPGESYESYNVVAIKDDVGMGTRILYAIFDGSEHQSTARLGHDIWQWIWSFFGSGRRQERGIELHRR